MEKQSLAWLGFVVWVLGQKAVQQQQGFTKSQRPDQHEPPQRHPAAVEAIGSGELGFVVWVLGQKAVQQQQGFTKSLHPDQHEPPQRHPTAAEGVGFREVGYMGRV